MKREDGLRIISSKDKLPKYVLVEANLMYQTGNSELVSKLTEGAMPMIRKWIPSLREQYAQGVQPIRGRDSFDQRDAFFDKVEYFRDPDFWQDYNIIEPTETLDKAIERIVRKY